MLFRSGRASCKSDDDIVLSRMKVRGAVTCSHGPATQNVICLYTKEVLYIPKRKTHSEFMHELEMRRMTEKVEILGKYVNQSATIKTRCLVDGYTWDASPKRLLLGNGCPKCGKTKRLTNEDFLESVSHITSKVEILDEYKNQKTKLLCKCKTCGNEWMAYPQNIKRGHLCQICSAKINGEKMTLGDVEFTRRIKEMSPNICIHNKYTNNTARMNCSCAECGNKWTTSAAVLLEGKGCPKCAARCRGIELRLSQEDFIDRVRLINRDVVVEGKYDGLDRKIKCSCLVCGHIWTPFAGNLLKGYGCPKCYLTHGERKISHILDDYKIQFVQQKRFTDCRNKRPLPFDFYLPKFNACIEYDGEQHFYPVRFNGCSEDAAQKSYNMTVVNDGIKDAYCKNNEIRLFRISYKQDIEAEINKIYKQIT